MDLTGAAFGASEAEELENLLSAQGVSITCEEDLVGEIWTDRPALSAEPAWDLDVKWAGESREDKLARIRKDMKEAGADLFLLTKLEDIAWLLNIRGGDIHTVPVVLAYLMMSEQEVRLYRERGRFFRRTEGDAGKGRCGALSIQSGVYRRGSDRVPKDGACR